MAEDVYCTLLLSDDYLPGVQVLAHSLRDGGTTKKLAVLIVSELRPETVTELHRLFDYVISIPRVVGRSHANLLMLNRPELNDTFSKINLWKQLQFKKIVYIDADVLVIRPPDELFQLDVPIAAAPDIGWPDCFNSGVILLQPNLGIYNGLLRLAEQGQSFDGADQGLLNEYFRNWYRLSFAYNCTPSSSYQYIPAYRHFESQISMVHFIGSEKPWNKTRSGTKTDSSWAPYEKLLGRWWAVWDRHYAPIVHHRFAYPSANHYPSQSNSSQTQEQEYHATHAVDNRSQTSQQVQEQQVQEQQPSRTTFTVGDIAYVPLSSATDGSHSETNQQHNWNGVASEGYVPPFIPPQQTWDPLKSPPPINSIPEGRYLSFSTLQNKWDSQTETSTERKLSKITELVKSANISDEPPVNLKPVFPWEERAKAPTRVFLSQSSRTIQSDRTAPSPVQDERKAEGQKSTSELTLNSEEEAEAKQEHSKPEYDQSQPQWREYVAANQWDSIPEISEYVSALRSRNRVFKPDLNADAQNGIILSTGYDDDEEDSTPLPVTPNPLRRRNQQGRTDEERFPSAPGVPTPTQWDPLAKLNELRNIPTSFLARQNGGRNGPRLSPKPSRAAMQSSSGAQTDASSLHSNSGAQTEDLLQSEQSTQWQRKEWEDDKSTQTEVGGKGGDGGGDSGGN